MPPERNLLAGKPDWLTPLISERKNSQEDQPGRKVRLRALDARIREDTSFILFNTAGGSITEMAAGSAA